MIITTQSNEQVTSSANGTTDTLKINFHNLKKPRWWYCVH